MNKRKLYERMRRSPSNVRFADALLIAEAFGFRLRRVAGDHHILACEGVPEIVNIQPDRNGMAKPYQIRQFLKIVDDNGLRLEDEA